MYANTMRTIHKSVHSKQKEMTGLQEMVFMGEIVLQSKIAQRAAERLQATNDNFDQIEVWSSIQSILIAAGNVSKILWPQEKKYESRGEKLRKLLNVDKSNLLFDRKFRNHFEHYDDRIEVWFKNQSSAAYRDLAMNPSMSNFEYMSNNRGYNSFNNTLIFRGESLDLGAVLNALEELRLNCSQYVLT